MNIPHLTLASPALRLRPLEVAFILCLFFIGFFISLGMRIIKDKLSHNPSQKKLYHLLTGITFTVACMALLILPAISHFRVGIIELLIYGITLFIFILGAKSGSLFYTLKKPKDRSKLNQ